MNNLNEEIEQTFDFPSNGNGTVQNLEQAFGGETNPSELFFEIAGHFQEKYGISKGVLVIRQDDSSLAAISTWSNGQKCDGLTLNLPRKESLFEKVVEDGRLYTEYFSESFSGNFFERKLLLGEQSQSFALRPLKVEGRVVGLVGFSAQNPTAFTTMEEGETDELLDRFAQKLIRQNSTA